MLSSKGSITYIVKTVSDMLIIFSIQSLAFYIILDQITESSLFLVKPRWTLMKCMNNKKGCPLYFVLLTLNYIYAPLGPSFSIMFVHMYMKYKAHMQWRDEISNCWKKGFKDYEKVSSSFFCMVISDTYTTFKATLCFQTRDLIFILSLFII